MNTYWDLNIQELSKELHKHDIIVTPDEEIVGKWTCWKIKPSEEHDQELLNLNISEDSWKSASVKVLSEHAPLHPEPDDITLLENMGVKLEPMRYKSSYQCCFRGCTREDAARKFINNAERWCEEKRKRAIRESWVRLTENLGNNRLFKSANWRSEENKLTVTLYCTNTGEKETFTVYATSCNYASFLMCEQFKALGLWSKDTDTNR